MRVADHHGGVADVGHQREELQALLLGALLLQALGDVGGDLQHLHHPPALEHRRVGRLQPATAAVAAHAFLDAGARRAVAQAQPELRIGGTAHQRRAECAVVTPANLFVGVTEQRLIVAVGVQHRAIRGELGDGHDPVEGASCANDVSVERLPWGVMVYSTGSGPRVDRRKTEGVPSLKRKGRAKRTDRSCGLMPA
jgi:hypothetical protein